MTPEQKNHDESILALIFAEVKRITKHLKIDRQSKGNPNDPDGVENPDESERLLRELLEKISEIADRKDFSTEQVAKLETMLNAVANVISKGQREQNQELKSSLERIGQALDTLKAEKQDSEIRHRHTIDIASSKVFISMIAMGLFILGLSFVIGNQRRTLVQFRDNDLKYRYVKMHGKQLPPTSRRWKWSSLTTAISTASRSSADRSSNTNGWSRNVPNESNRHGSMPRKPNASETRSRR